MIRALTAMSTFFAIVLTANVAPAQGGRGVNPAKYGWLSSYEQAKTRAKKTGKPIMVVLRCVP